MKKLLALLTVILTARSSIPDTLSQEEFETAVAETISVKIPKPTITITFTPLPSLTLTEIVTPTVTLTHTSTRILTNTIRPTDTR